jgi:hypothetical protein
MFVPQTEQKKADAKTVALTALTAPGSDAVVRYDLTLTGADASDVADVDASDTQAAVKAMDITLDTALTMDAVTAVQDGVEIYAQAAVEGQLKFVVVADDTLALDAPVVSIAGTEAAMLTQVMLADAEGVETMPNLSTATAEDEPTEFTTTLTGKRTVEQGAAFSVNYGLKDVDQAIYAQESVVEYVTDLFEYTGATALSEKITLVDPADADGTRVATQVKLLIASLGEDNAVTTDGDLVQLNFRAKVTGETNTGAITIVKAVVGDEEGQETAAAGSTINITLNAEGTPPEFPGDYNDDGKVSIGDLAMMAKHYGKDLAAVDWNKIKKFDMNSDGKIDILDLAAMARLITG